MSIQTTYDYLTPADYVYNPLLIGVAAGASLIFQNNPGQDFTQDFLSDVGFIYNASNTEFVAGVMRQIQKAYRPTYYLGTFFAGYDTSIDGDYGYGVLTGTAAGGASISGGKLDLAGGTVKYVSYDADFNADSQQVGCIRFKITPNYNGVPVVSQIFCRIEENVASDNNAIIIYHNSVGGNLTAAIRSSIGVDIFNTSFGAWLPTLGQNMRLSLIMILQQGPQDYS